LRDGAVALLIISHVLEHVADAGLAMAEMARVVQPGGRAIALVPSHPTNAHTVEDPAVTDPKERARVFGQHDHVRWFGHDDYVARLETAGFAVDVLHYAEAFTSEEQARYGLTDVPLYICKR
jgi:SAM-dependent methyltransferase